jgi:hypothetical protein
MPRNSMRRCGCVWVPFGSSWSHAQSQAFAHSLSARGNRGFGCPWLFSFPCSEFWPICLFRFEGNISHNSFLSDQNRTAQKKQSPRALEPGGEPLDRPNPSSLAGALDGRKIDLPLAVSRLHVERHSGICGRPSRTHAIVKSSRSGEPSTHAPKWCLSGSTSPRRLLLQNLPQHPSAVR